jgi:hypothetical protein
MRPEPDHPDRRDPGQPQHCRRCHLQPAARLTGRQRQERQHQPGRQLDADARGQGDRGEGQPRVLAGVPARARRAPHRRRSAGTSAASGGHPAGAQRQPECQRHDHQRVVVRAPHGQHQQHRVEADEDGRERRGHATPLGGARRQRDCSQAAERGQRFQRPQRPGEPQRRGGIAGEREQRAVRRVLERPADEAEHGIAHRLCWEVRVRVEAMQRAHPREGDVAEHVLGDQRGAQRQDHVRRHDRARKPAERQPASPCQSQRVAAAHDQHQGLKAAAAQVRPEPRQRTGEPARPAAAVGGDVARRGRGRIRHQHRKRREQTDDPRPGQGAGGRSGVLAPQLRAPLGAIGW